MSSRAIAPGTRVTLHFSLALPDGQLVDSTFGKAPASFVLGDGSLLPGFEAVLPGLRAGDEREVLVPAVEAFGLRQEANLKRLPRERFAPDLVLEPGLVLMFAAAEGGELPGVVHRLMGEMVEIDFNHPLAGRDIRFRVQVVAVEPAGGD